MTFQVNKTMGCTLTMPVALEVTSRYYPWEPGQVVVGLSRNEAADKICMVTDKTPEWAVGRLWDTLCIATQWTAMTEDIINRLSVSCLSEDSTCQIESNVLNISDTFPWRMRDYQLPNSKVGCIYMIVSTTVPNFVDVGQTGKGVQARVAQHQRLQGNQFTNYHAYAPFAIAAFMTNLDGLDQSARESLERKWQHLNKSSMRRGRVDIQTCMDNGDIVVCDHNDKISDPSKHVRLIKLLKRKSEN